MDNLSPYKGKNKLDYNMLKDYNAELKRFEALTDPYYNLKYTDPESFYSQLTETINKIDDYEKTIGSKFKGFKGNKDYHKTRSYTSDEVNKYYGSEVINADPFNRNKNKNNTSTNTNSADTTINNTVETTVNKPDPYAPKIGDNIVRSSDSERFVLTGIDKADPSIDIHNDTYHYRSPNGDKFSTSRPLDPTDPNGNYFLDDNILSPDDVTRINNTFEDLRYNTDLLEQAQDQLSAAKDAYSKGTGNLDEIYQLEKSVRSLEEKVANTRYQIELDDQKFNNPNSSKQGYFINEKTQNYMNKSKSLLENYRNRTRKNINDVFKDNMPRQTVDTIEAGFDNTIHIPNNTTVNNNIKNSTKRVRGKKKGQATGRGNRKKVVSSTGRINKNTIS